MAPELIDGKEYGFSVDLWGLVGTSQPLRLGIPHGMVSREAQSSRYAARYPQSNVGRTRRPDRRTPLMCNGAQDCGCLERHVVCAGGARV
jgi:hypothetical protein